MPNNCLSVLYKHIIQVENKNVGLKVCVWGGGEGAQIYHCPPIKKCVCVWGGGGGGGMPPYPRFLHQCYIAVCVCVFMPVSLSICIYVCMSKTPTKRNENQDNPNQ